MKVVVTGAAGQLGAELCRLLGPQAIAVDIDTLDLTNGPAVLEALPRLRPEAVIHCAAYTAVDLAESEPEKCRAANVTAVLFLVQVCHRLDCPLVQISTDYVFGGASPGQRPWREDDPPAPRGVYAISKLLGEQAAAVHEKHLIVRTCGLYARPAHQQARNFVKTILRLAETKPKLCVVADQHCTPTYVPHVARAIAFLLGGNGAPAAPWGIYHVTNRGETTWFDFAVEILRLARRSVPIEAITTADYPSPAPRPAYSVLDTTAYYRLGGPPMPDWKAALAEYFAEYSPSPSGRG
ncbi:MAG: dTDP-4-dehydrorhamnose reductase [Thermoguttaceae bacterium]|jgi:dTDP-4-dehydrorhamnose reductase